MPLSDYQLERCLNVMDEIKRRKISEPFFKPIDQAIENLPEDYTQKVTKFIDLSIIRDNLVNGIYSTVDDWKKDVNILWENFFKVFLNSDPPYLMAKELQEIFNKLTNLLTDDPTSDWEANLSILKENFVTLSKNEPKSIFSDGINSQLPSSSTSSAPSKKRSSTTTKNKKKQQANSNNRPPIAEPQGKSSSKYYQHEESIINPSSDSTNISSDVDIIQLQEDINKVADDDNMPKMIEIIKENEYSYQNNENDEIEVDLQQLSKKTLQLLRDYIDTLLKEQNK